MAQRSNPFRSCAFLWLFPPDNCSGNGASQAAVSVLEGQSDNTVTDRGDFNVDGGQVVRLFDL